MTDPRARRLYGALLAAAYVAIVVTPIVAIAVARYETGHAFIYLIGTNLALAAFGIIALQFVLSARFRWVEKPFGQDLLYDFHKAMAVVAAIFIVSHPLLMAMGDGVWDLLYDPAVGWEIWLGRVALLIVLLQVVISSFRATLGVEYELWKRWHNVVALVLLVSIFLHSRAAGGAFDIGFVQWYWAGLLLLGLGTWLTSSVIRPLRLRRAPWTVVSLEQESHDTWTVALEPPQGVEPYEHAPGQFHFLTLRRGRELPEERHHWTISSSPTEPRVRASTIKALGDFTGTIGETKPGDEAEVYGPYGRFSHTRYPDEKDLVFVAGGIGITPIMSMLRYMRETGDDRRVLLVYANPTERDIVFRDELEEIARGEAPRLRIIHMLEDPPDGWGGETGMFDPDRMSRFFGERLERAGFYVCGPPPMMEIVIRWLRGEGVPARRIHSERFDI